VFAVLSALLAVALLSYGGVLNHAWLTLEILWVIALTVVLAFQFVGRRTIDRTLVSFIAASGLTLLLAQPKLAVGLMAVGWAYLATGRGNFRSIHKFFYFLLFVGCFEAVLGLVQYLIAPGWILGYQNPFYRTSGTLINRNHFAGLLEMLIPVTLGLAYSSMRRFGDFARPYMFLLAGAFMGLALLFSTSRMGIFSFLVTVAFVATLLQFRKSHGRTGLVLGVGMVALVLAGALWVGVDSIVARYSELSGDDGILREGRVLVYQDVLRMIAGNPGGVGTGNFQHRFRQYQTFHPEVFFDHAHSDYLETAAEWGLPVAAAFWSLLIFVVIRNVRLFVSIQAPEECGVLLACTGAIFSILLHSLTDFNLQIPSNAMLFFTFVGISLALPLKERAGNYAKSAK
jgi:O-antigen ligase